MVWNKQLKREIPKGWEVKEISSICDIISGYSFQSTAYTNSGKYRLITIKNIQDYGVNLNVDNYINDLPDNLPKYCVLSPRDILISLTGNVGRVGIMFINDCLLHQRVALIKPHDDAFTSFIYIMFKGNQMRLTLENSATGTSQKNLSPIDTGQNMYTIQRRHYKTILPENEIYHRQTYCMPKGKSRTHQTP